MTQPLPGQLSLLADTDVSDAHINTPEARYDGHSGILADAAGAFWRGYSPDTDAATARRCFGGVSGMIRRRCGGASGASCSRGR